MCKGRNFVELINESDIAFLKVLYIYLSYIIILLLFK